MRVLLIVAGFTLMATGTVAFAGAADACLECHGSDADFSLAGEGAENIAEWAKEIRAGDVRHPVGLDDLTDEQIAEIAAALNDV